MIGGVLFTRISLGEKHDMIPAVVVCVLACMLLDWRNIEPRLWIRDELMGILDSILDDGPELLVLLDIEGLRARRLLRLAGNRSGSFSFCHVDLIGTWIPHTF